MSLGTEISQIFSAWASKETAEKKILESYKELGSESRFHCFEFPRENLSEYLQTKTILSNPIRRVLEKLRLYKNQSGEDYRHEVGLLDMQEAIQVIASRSQRTDVFVRDELQSREDAWAVLIDASHSLKFFTGEVRGITLCLSEVARELFPNQNAWAQFAFSDKFYVLKDFSEIYSNRIRARLGGLEHGGMSYIPDAMFLAAEALKRRTEELKLLVVVSDFFPSGYINAEDKLTQCVKKIEKSGMGVIGIGVKSRAVKNYFRIACVVDNPYDLMKKFVQAFFEFSSTA
jgi:nitric oxide reductase activation protein